MGERSTVDSHGHPSPKVRKFSLDIIYHFPSMLFLFCDACHCNKSKQLLFVSSLSICSGPLELLHSDLWEPSPVSATRGHQYYIHFTGHFSHFLWMFPLHQESDALSVFISFKLHVEKLLGCANQASPN